MMNIWKFGKILKDTKECIKYQNLGRVKSLKYGREKILKGCKDKDGYQKVNLSKDGKQKNYLIHRLVAQTFLDNTNNLPEVNHKDENPQNNRVENIEYCDMSYNVNYGSRNERMAKSRSKPVLQFTKEWYFIKKWESAKEVERELGICNSNISSCCKGKIKTAYGFVWMYAVINGFEIDINKLKKVA